MPAVLNLCAHQLWTGDLVHEGCSVMRLHRITLSRHEDLTIIEPGVFVAYGTMTLGRWVKNRWFELYGECDRLTVMRGAPTPSGYLNALDIEGVVHSWGPHLPKPCSCTWHE